MTRVTDEDLAFMVNLMEGHVEAVDCDHSGELGDAIRAELLALRKVAETTAKIARDIPHDISWVDIRKLLEEVGL